ncbi:reverse transcriptase [Artemisia annua]|uniref:Reverse transcriptase n=1 Tax=Artemisia annua TaxID=35608 RepID=A0A2U1LTC4_ARTAN|nr:reverse transcriptase [Artemisia annua]
MVDDGSEWDIERIQTLFPSEIVKRILSTHISSHRSDSLFWEGTAHGNFTVRDAYKKELENRGLINNLTDVDSKICLSLWKAAIPMKVKLFIWRAWLNLLPTVCNLQRRHVILNDGFCVHCCDPDEDVLHALFQCVRVRQSPPNGFVKLNCDAAWLPSSKQAGLGFVARNFEGEVIFRGQNTSSIQIQSL